MVSMIINHSMIILKQNVLAHLLHGVEFLEVSPMLFSSSFHKVHCYLIKEMIMIIVVIYMLAMIMLIMVLTTSIMMIMVLTDGGDDDPCQLWCRRAREMTMVILVVMTMIMMLMTKMVVMMIPAKYYLVDFDAGKLESDPHSPRARGTEVGIKFWPGEKFCQKKL